MIHEELGGVPKRVIEQAIATGEGKSSSGKPLEPFTVEAMMPVGVAFMIDIETDSRNKIKQEFLNPIRKFGGTMSGAAYFFNRKGRAVFAAKEGVDVDNVLEPSIEFGAEDVVTDDEGNIIVSCAVADLARLTTGMADKLMLSVLESAIVWDPNVVVELDDNAVAERLAKFLSVIRSDIPDIQGVYTNAVQGKISDDIWESIIEHID